MDYLPRELNLDYSDLLNLCDISTKYRQVCHNTHFWQIKSNKDFGSSDEEFSRTGEQ